MIDTSLLRLNILNLATSGKLSVSSEQDESVDALISRLPAPSNKRKKLLEQSFDYDDTFEIPDHWKWVRLGEICSYGDTPTKAMASDCEKGTWLLDLEDIQAGGKLLKKSKVGEKSSIGEKTSFKEGQLLYSKLRPYLKKVLVADEDGISTPELIASDVFCGINAEYLVYCLTNSYVDRVINKRSYGIKMPRVDAGFMVNLPIPLPPVEEQSRIVDVVMAAFLEIDNIDELQSQYASDLEVLKSKLIDAGIQGKLTEQLPEDGNAQDLYDAIQEEKAKLVKEKKIKKEKPLADISENEIPFAIPSSWKWVRLNSIGSWSAGSTPSRSNAEYYGGSIPWVKTGELANSMLTQTEEYVTELALKECSLRINPVGSVLIAMYGATIGKVAILEINATTNQACCACIPYTGIYNRYLFYYLLAHKNAFISKSHGGAQPNISKDIIINELFPLPPINEQKRIVDKLDALLQKI